MKVFTHSMKSVYCMVSFTNIYMSNLIFLASVQAMMNNAFAGFVSFKICYKIVNCALDGVDICINWSNMVNLLLNDNLTALRQSVKFGVHNLRKFICYSREC